VSNHLAVATVTATLQTLLLNAASAVPGAKVTMRRPDATPAAAPGINAFLYQVSPNPAYRNADLPTRSAAGGLRRKPQAALILHYLFSFIGDDGQFEPQRLLGATVRELHSQPAIRPTDIASTIKKPPFDTLLAASDLAEQVDLVRLVPLNLSLDELSKMWSIFFQVPYALSVAYQASAVLIEADEMPRIPLPVKERNTYVVPLREPVIDAVVSAAGDDAPIVAGSTLLIRGRNLRSSAPLVSVGGVEQVPPAVSDTTITLPVPAGLAAGVHAVQVVQKMAMGADAPKKPQHQGFESNVASFVLRPRVSKKIGKAAGGTLEVTLDVKVRKTQRAVLVLNSTTSSFARSFDVEPLTADAFLIKFKVPGVPAGKYFASVQVEGAVSPVDLNPASPTFGPTVTLP
jgi:Pvc16 N-terminal domain/IPT/TIG domain